MRKYEALEVTGRAAPDKHISLTDQDARSRAAIGKGSGLVGYNVQAVVDAQHHLIVAHGITNIGNDRSARDDGERGGHDSRSCRVERVGALWNPQPA